MKFTSIFYKAFHHVMGMNLNLSTSNLPQFDGKKESIIQTLKDMMHVCILESGENCKDHFELTYINSYRSSIEMASYEAFYGINCMTPLCWAKFGDK